MAAQRWQVLGLLSEDHQAADPVVFNSCSPHAAENPALVLLQWSSRRMEDDTNEDVCIYRAHHGIAFDW